MPYETFQYQPSVPLQQFQLIDETREIYVMTADILTPNKLQNQQPKFGTRKNTTALFL